MVSLHKSNSESDKSIQFSPLLVAWTGLVHVSFYSSSMCNLSDYQRFLAAIQTYLFMKH